MKTRSKIFFRLFSLFLAGVFISSTALANDAFFENLKKGVAYYETVQNYECIFYKTEPASKSPKETEQIFLKFEKPFKIFMGWESGRKKGLQVFYERGRFDNKLAIHQPGVLFGLVSLLFLEQSSPYVREGSEAFDIEDAGIGTFLTDFRAAVQAAQSEGKLEIHATNENSYEVIFKNTQENEVYFAYRVLVLFDPNTGLPVSQELFDWQNQFIGKYVYENIQVNVGEQSDFKKHVHNSIFRIYPTPEPTKKRVSKTNFNSRPIRNGSKDE